MLGRQTRNLVRQPIWIFIMLVQPFFWLLLYSQLFRRIVDLPGFGSDSYIDFLTPGIVVMTAFFSASWSGMAMIEDIDRGVIERFLATPARRSSLVLSQVVRAALTAAIQTLIILTLGLALGASMNQGAVGWLIVLAVAALVAGGFAGFSHGIALMTRREETMIAVVNFLGLPLVFLSSTLIAASLTPSWIQWAARFNPVDWGVVAAREMAVGTTDWDAAGWRLAALVAFVVAMTAFATRAFRVYRRAL
jgi:ABC-2 type transport system permease protein